MKYNRILILALASIILAVITSSTAFAATYTYDGRSESYYNSPSDYSQLTNSYGEKTVVYDDKLKWYFGFNNGRDYDLPCIISASGFDLTTYSYGGFSHTTYTYTVPANGYTGGSRTGTVTCSSNRHSIEECHGYLDGGRSYNLMFGWTGSNSSSKAFRF
jgi:hypothetical protein